MKLVFSKLIFNIMTRMIAGKGYFDENTLKSEETKRFQEIIAESSALAGASNIGDFMPIVRRFVFNKWKRGSRFYTRKETSLCKSG